MKTKSSSKEDTSSLLRRPKHVSLNLLSLVKPREQALRLDHIKFLQGSVFLDRDGKHFRLSLLPIAAVVFCLFSSVGAFSLGALFLLFLSCRSPIFPCLGLVDGITEVLNKRMEDEEIGTELT
ncbi:hypothetical protein Tco_0428899 [Tanacetum coccineum]